MIEMKPNAAVFLLLYPGLIKYLTSQNQKTTAEIELAAEIMKGSCCSTHQLQEAATSDKEEKAQVSPLCLSVQGSAGRQHRLIECRAFLSYLMLTD